MKRDHDAFEKWSGWHMLELAYMLMNVAFAHRGAVSGVAE